MNEQKTGKSKLDKGIFRAVKKRWNRVLPRLSDLPWEAHQSG